MPAGWISKFRAFHVHCLLKTVHCSTASRFHYGCCLVGVLEVGTAVLDRKVLIYLRARRQGVSREHQNLLPVSQAEKLWSSLKTEQHVDAAALPQLEKEIVAEYTVPTGVCLAGTLASNPWTLPMQLETPKKQGGSQFVL